MWVYVVTIVLFWKVHALDFFFVLCIDCPISKKPSIKLKIFSSPLSLFFFSIKLCDVICVLLEEPIILNLNSIFKTFRLD